MIRSTFGQNSDDLGSEVVGTFVSFIAGHFGLRLTDAQVNDLTAAIGPLLATTDYPTPTAMLREIVDGHRSDLLAALVSRVTISETHFFRVAPQMKVLREIVIPEILTRRQDERQIDVWSAGCSSGEEPYTLAILLREQLPQLAEWDVRLLATDINEVALASAEAASYGDWSFRETSELARTSYFTRRDRRWLVIEPVRRMVHFARLNLAHDPFPSPGPSGPTLDLIVCRNVTIYFDPLVTQRLYERFAEALVPGGWLLLGPSDPGPTQPGPFEPVYAHEAVLWRRRAFARSEPATSSESSLAVERRLTGHSSNDLLPPSPGDPDLTRDSGATNRPVPAAIGSGQAPRSGLAELESHLRAHPLDADAHARLGLTYLEAGAVERALATLRRATFLNPNDALAHFGRSRACLRLGDPQGALVALSRAWRILETLSANQEIPGSDGLTTDELRRVIDLQLKSIAGQTRST